MWTCGKCQSGVRMVDGRMIWCDCPSTVEYLKKRAQLVRDLARRRGRSSRQSAPLGFTKASQALRGMGL